MYNFANCFCIGVNIIIISTKKKKENSSNLLAFINLKILRKKLSEESKYIFPSEDVFPFGGQNKSF